MTYLYVLSLIIISSIVIAFTIRMFIEIWPALHFGAIYVPTSDKKLKTMLSFATIKKGEKVIDLGSGDGRVVIAAATKGADAVGVELHSKMLKKSKQEINKLKLKNAEIRKENMWKTDVSDFDIVFVYGVVYIMKKMEKKLLKELKPGARVVSNNYQFPNWNPVKEKDNIRLYIVPS